MGHPAPRGEAAGPSVSEPIPVGPPAPRRGGPAPCEAIPVRLLLWEAAERFHPEENNAVGALALR